MKSFRACEERHLALLQHRQTVGPDDPNAAASVLGHAIHFGERRAIAVGGKSAAFPDKKAPIPGRRPQLASGVLEEHTDRTLGPALTHPHGLAVSLFHT